VTIPRPEVEGLRERLHVGGHERSAVVLHPFERDLAEGVIVRVLAEPVRGRHVGPRRERLDAAVGP
jgi:hypothetical protein